MDQVSGKMDEFSNRRDSFHDAARPDMDGFPSDFHPVAYNMNNMFSSNNNIRRSFLEGITASGLQFSQHLDFEPDILPKRDLSLSSILRTSAIHERKKQYTQENPYFPDTDLNSSAHLVHELHMGSSRDFTHADTSKSKYSYGSQVNLDLYNPIRESDALSYMDVAAPDLMVKSEEDYLTQPTHGDYRGNLLLQGEAPTTTTTTPTTTQPPLMMSRQVNSLSQMPEGSLLPLYSTAGIHQLTEYHPYQLMSVSPNASQGFIMDNPSRPSVGFNGPFVSHGGGSGVYGVGSGVVSGGMGGIGGGSGSSAQGSGVLTIGGGVVGPGNVLLSNYFGSIPTNLLPANPAPGSFVGTNASAGYNGETGGNTLFGNASTGSVGTGSVVSMNDPALLRMNSSMRQWPNMNDMSMLMNTQLRQSGGAPYATQPFAHSQPAFVQYSQHLSMTGQPQPQPQSLVPSSSSPSSSSLQPQVQTPVPIQAIMQMNQSPVGSYSSQMESIKAANPRYDSMNEHHSQGTDSTDYVSSMTSERDGSYVPSGSSFAEKPASESVHSRNLMAIEKGMRKQWTGEEKGKLDEGFEKYGDDWAKISKFMFNGSRTPEQCAQRYKYSQDPKKIKGKFSRLESQQLSELYTRHRGDWGKIELEFPTRTRQALINHYKECLDPSRNREWTHEMDLALEDGVAKYGGKKFAKIIPEYPCLAGKTSNQCKSRHATIMNKKKHSVQTNPMPIMGDLRGMFPHDPFPQMGIPPMNANPFYQQLPLMAPPSYTQVPFVPNHYPMNPQPVNIYESVTLPTPIPPQHQSYPYSARPPAPPTNTTSEVKQEPNAYLDNLL